jgi:hypothetical protein
MREVNMITESKAETAGAGWWDEEGRERCKSKK